MRPADPDFGDPDRAVYVAIAMGLVDQCEFAGLTAAARANLVLQTAYPRLAPKLPADALRRTVAVATVLGAAGVAGTTT